MTAIWQQRDGQWRLLAPAGFPDEATLHDRVEEAPQLLPLAGSPSIAVVGREVRLGSGYADLIAVEPTGRPVIIEVKLARNAEARRAVVAQVLAYAAYLYGLTVGELERDVLKGHLQQRGYTSVAEAVTAADQAGRINTEEFEEALGANLASGRFRLVVVLDEAPDELVKLVGYLEAVTPELVIDLVTVGQYDVGGSAVLIPQRVEPERSESPAAVPEAARSGDGGYVAEGAGDFAALVDASPPDAQPQLRSMCDWAIALEEEGLIGNLATYHNKRSVTLIPALPIDNAGIVTIWHSDAGGRLQFWRSVLERRAPNTLPAVEAAAAPATVGQGTVTYEVSDELLAVLTDAYREAIESIRG